MARTWKDEESLVKRRVLASMTCDICGTSADSFEDLSGISRNWSKAPLAVGGTIHNIAKTTVKLHLENSYSYDSGGSGVITRFDICPKCFVEKLIPFFESLGGKESIEEIDY